MSKTCVIIYMNLGPHHVARLRALAKVLPEMHAIEVAAARKRYSWRTSKERLGFALTTLFPDRACEDVPVQKQCAVVKTVLSGIRPEAVVVSGYAEPVMRAAAKWAWRRKIPTVLQFVSTYRDKPRKWWKELFKSRLLRRYTTIAATGQLAAEYALRLGAKKDSIYRIGNVVDNAHYAACCEALRSKETQERARLSLPDRYFLTVSRLSPEKNLLMLLAAFGDYRKRGGTWDLVLVGGGPQEQELREVVKSQVIPGVHLLGWKQYDDLPAYYALASCFVLPSVSEPWGLVVNEAMACGLPVLVSEACGCVPELCKPGENGFTFAHNATDQLVERMVQVSSGDEQLSAFGKTSRKIISSFTPQTWAAALRECILNITG